MVNKKSIAEDSIDKLPIIGHIKLTFVKLSPTFQLIHRKIPLQFLSNTYGHVYNDLSNAGVFLKLDKRNIGISDYYKFVCKLFPDFDVQDCQSEKVGKPDFFIVNNKTEFYLEVKNTNDGLRSTQMNWISNNQNKEVWVLYIGGLFVDEFGKAITYYDMS